MQERKHHPSGPLALAVALAASAGFVDAFIYVNVVPVFVANMSGNMIHLGIEMGDGRWGQVAAAVIALAAFTAGVVLATIHHDRQLARGRDVQPTYLLAAEATLVALLTLWLVVTATPFSADPVPADYPVLLAAGSAMGMQAGALRLVGEITVATTYGTGAIVRIGEKIVLAARRADRATEHRRRVTIAVLTIVLVSYVAGAVAATLAGSSPWLLAVPTAALIACAVASRRGSAQALVAPADGT